MATILNVDGSNNVVDITRSSRPTTVDDVAQTAAELGAPIRTGCTQTILTADQEALLATALGALEIGQQLTWDGSAFGTATA